MLPSKSGEGFSHLIIAGLVATMRRWETNRLNYIDSQLASPFGRLYNGPTDTAKISQQLFDSGQNPLPWGRALPCGTVQERGGATRASPPGMD